MFAPHSNEANLPLASIVMIACHFNFKNATCFCLGNKNAIRVCISDNSPSFGTVCHVKKDIDLRIMNRLAHVVNNMKFDARFSTVVASALEFGRHRINSLREA